MAKNSCESLIFDRLEMKDEKSPFNHPMFVMNVAGHARKEVFVNFKSEGDNFTNVIENTILEYNPSAGEQETYIKWVDSSCFMEKHHIYMKSYITVGIPTGTYNRIFEAAQHQFEENIAITYNTINDGNTWITAELHSNPTVNYSINLQENFDRRSLYDIMTQLKSSICGYGRFKISIVQEEFGLRKHFLKFTLLGFQLLDETKMSSSIGPCMANDISEELKTKLGKINHY